MTKREFNAYNKRLEALKSLYGKYVSDGHISNNDSKQVIVRQMIDNGVHLMCTIGEIADEITITGYDKVVNEVNNMISKKDFVDIVRFVAYHDKEKNKNYDDTKLTARLLKEIDESVFKINFKRTFYNQYINMDDYSMVDTPKNVDFPKLKYCKNNKKLKEIVNSCAKARRYLDDTLWPMYKEYASDGDLTYDRYKKLVDYSYYTDDSDPRFQGQEKRWQKLVETFLYNYRLCKKYGFNDYFQEVEEEVFKLKSNAA